MRALVVDDEPTVCLLLSRILTRDFDCETTAANNGIEALDLLARQRYDFVLLDMIMPVMSGIETLEAIRRDPTLQHLPVMVLSTVREEARVREAIGLGISTYMTKPLQPGEVSERLSRFVSGVGRDDGSPPPVRTLAGLPKGARLLVVDGDREFRNLVAAVLGEEYVVSQAATGTQALGMALEQRPAVIFLGRNLGALSAPRLLDKVRGLPALDGAAVVATMSERAEQTLPGADAMIARSLTPEDFGRQFTRLVAAEPPDVRILRERPALRGQLIAAAEQVFGRMVETEIFADPRGPSAAPGDDLACVPIALPGLACDLQVLIAAPRQAAAVITRRMLQRDDVGEGEITAALQELANMLGGHIQDRLRSAGTAATMGLPSSGVWPSGERSPATEIDVSFRTGNGDLRFSAVIRTVRREPAAGLLVYCAAQP